MKISKIIVILLSGLLLAGCGQPAPKTPGKYAETAKCLAQKGVIMYGAYWCPHCANQKASFGDDFQFVHYQECDDKGAGGNHKACLEAGVTSYPTWYFPGQGNLVGEQSVADLAKLANCTETLSAEDQQKLKDAEKAADEANKQGQTTTQPATATEPAPTAPTTPTNTK
jgi:hypothetical protein